MPVFFLLAVEFNLFVENELSITHADTAGVDKRMPTPMKAGEPSNSQPSNGGVNDYDFGNVAYEGGLKNTGASAAHVVGQNTIIGW